MDKYEKSGTCAESELLECIFDESYSSFVAYLTDQFVAGVNTFENLSRIETDKLLEIRIFNKSAELMARRTMIGEDHPFQWRIANEEGLSKDEYIERFQTIDMDSTRTYKSNSGNLCIMSTGGGRYELPIREDHDRIRIISYVRYDSDGMACIYDDRLAGFVTKGGKVDV